MDPLIAFLIVITVILTTLLVVVGIQVIIILRNLNKTLEHVNRTLSHTDTVLNLISHPFEHMGGTITGIKSGLRIAETFIIWLKEHNHEQPKLHDR